MRTQGVDPSANLEGTDLWARYCKVRDGTLKLIAPLTLEDCVAQSMPDASPAKWHLAHTTWFFETFVLETCPGYQPFDPDFRSLWNSYYQSVGPQHARSERGLLTRPSLGTVLDYRAWVDERMQSLLQTGGATALRQLIMLGLAHEQQHQELLLTDVKHLLSHQPGLPAYRTAQPPQCQTKIAAAGPRPITYHHGPDGLQAIGHHGNGFAFDNERPRHQIHVGAYEIATRLVTCAEWRKFIADDGYRRPQLWLSDGWNAVQRHGWTAPLYWHWLGGDEWTRPWIFTLDGPRPVTDEEPVCHISFYEADAFARWAGQRLPTEAEWELAVAHQPVVGNFLDSERLHPMPDPAADAHRPRQLFGDLWEWTASAYAPYPGYRPPDGPLGEYNGKFMCNQFVLRGGSCVTPPGHIRASYRNFFPPTARWQFTGLRLARDA